METSPLSTALKPNVGAVSEAEQKYQEALAQLNERLDARKNRLFDPTLLAMAQGLLGPTQTGSAFEAIGRAAEKVGASESQQQKEDIDIAKMRLEMARSGREMEREKGIEQAIPALYTKSPTGEMQFNPEAAQNLARLTKDPKIMQMIYEQDKTQRLREAGQNVFTPTTTQEGKTTYKFNPDSVFALARASDNPMKTIAEYADMVPKLRKAGMLSDLQGDITTPFDAIVLMADGLGTQGAAWKAQAQRLAKQFQTGMIDEEKGNSLAQQMMAAINSSVDKQTALENTKIMQQFQRMMAQNTFDLNQEKLREKRDENEKKLSDEQKITFSKIVTPIINEGIKASSALMQVQTLKNVIEDAPSGFVSGYTAKTVGAYRGTKENEALRRIESISSGLIPLVPRLPGSASDRDSKKIEQSLGDLKDPKLTTEQRRALVKDIQESLERLSDRADRVQTYWDSNKKFNPKILEVDAQQTPATSEGMTATMPDGKGGSIKIQVRNGKWVNMQTGKPVE